MRLDDHWLAIVTSREILHERRLPDEVDDRRALVLLQIDPEVSRRARIRPGDTIAFVEYDDTVRQRFGASHEAIERKTQVALPRAAQAHPPVQLAVSNRPYAASFRDGCLDRSRRPAPKLPQMEQMPAHEDECADREHAERYAGVEGEPGHRCSQRN